MKVYVLMMFNCLDCGQLANVYDTLEAAEKAGVELEKCEDVKYACIYEREVITSDVDMPEGDNGKEKSEEETNS